MTRDGTGRTRRAVVAGLTALAGAGYASASRAQFSIFGVDVGNVARSLQNIFEGLSLTEEEEIEMGEKLFPRLLAMSGGPYQSNRLQGAMGEIFEPLRASSGRPNLPWEIAVVNDNTVNAWALPGGKIAVNKGLLRYVDSEDELAGVISHEMGHAELSHVIREMRKEKFYKGLSGLAREGISSQAGRLGGAGLLTSQALDLLAGPLHDMVRSGYAKSSEHEADQHILTVFATTGHDPVKAVNIFRTLLELVPANSQYTTSLYNSHPGTRERIAKILAAAGAAPRPQPRPPGAAYAVLKESFPTRRVFKRNPPPVADQSVGSSGVQSDAAFQSRDRAQDR